MRFAVIGLGRFGMRLAQLLTRNGAEVIAVDINRELVEQARDEVTLAVRLDATDKTALQTQGIDKVDCAIVGIGTDFEANALTVSTLKAIGVPKVIARAGSEVRGTILERIGADAVVFPERESAQQWANRLMVPHLRDYVELGEGHAIAQIRAPASFANKSPEQLSLRQRYHVNLVAIRRTVAVDSGDRTTETQVVSVPTAQTKILPSDILVLIGSDEALAALPTD
ncbi:MAG: potassium channel family protein [Phycisphaerae bacterium]